MRTSNVTKFLAASSSLGVPRDEIFHRDDLIEATPESLARVAKNILAQLDKPEDVTGHDSSVRAADARDGGSC